MSLFFILITTVHYVISRHILVIIDSKLSDIVCVGPLLYDLFTKDAIIIHHHNCIKLMRSICVADTAIIPIQDYLHLGKEARMNIPSTLGGNWIWRVNPDALNDTLAKKIKSFTSLYGRDHSKLK